MLLQSQLPDGGSLQIFFRGLAAVQYCVVLHCHCFSHCCIVVGNHGIDFNVLITQSNEWYELSTYRCLKSASHMLVPQLPKIEPLSWLVWLSHLLQTNSKSHHHQIMVTSYVYSRKIIFLWMLTPDRKRFFTKM